MIAEKIILFDGVCNLCNGVVNLLIRIDSKDKLRFASLQSTAGQRILKNFKLSDRELDTIYYLRGDILLQKSTAVLNILKDLGGGYKVLYIFIVIPPFIRDFLYRIVAKYRYKLFGIRDTCRMPEPTDMHKFIS